jgi:hypothetical protein
MRQLAPFWLLQVSIDESSYEEVVEEKESQSYPGLRSKVSLGLQGYRFRNVWCLGPAAPTAMQCEGGRVNCAHATKKGFWAGQRRVAVNIIAAVARLLPQQGDAEEV